MRSVPQGRPALRLCSRGFQNEVQDGKGRSGQTLSAVGFSAVLALAGLLGRESGF